MTSYPLFQTQCGSSAAPVILGWNSGLLVSVPNNQSCTSETSFSYVDPATSTFKTNVIPPLNVSIVYLQSGEGSDLWVWGYQGSSAATGYFLYFYSYEHNQWNNVDIAPLENPEINQIEWDSLNNYLVLATLSGTSTKLYKVSMDQYPPSGCTDMHAGPLAGSAGRIDSVASIQQANSNTPEVYVVGEFNYAGNGVSVRKAAKCSNGVWEQFSAPAGENLALLASYESILYYSWIPESYLLDADFFLPVGALNTTTGESVPFASLPLVISSTGGKIVSAIYADANYVYVAGIFILSTEDGDILNNSFFLLLFFC